MDLCRNSKYVQPFLKNNSAEKHTVVSKLPIEQVYSKNKLLLETSSPNRLAAPTYCKTNNMCENNATYTYLNKRGVGQSPFFQKTEAGTYKSTIQDDRLFDTSRNYNMTLDTPPIQVFYDLKHDNVSGSTELHDYGRNYTSYNTVNAGQIQYYIDKDISDPFFAPVYGLPSKTTAYAWNDPMGTPKIQFEKKFDTLRMTRTGMLSSIEDTTKHRDDIMARQQRTHNERRYDLVYNMNHN
jgi:hypothetical protein